MKFQEIEQEADRARAELVLALMRTLRESGPEVTDEEVFRRAGEREAGSVERMLSSRTAAGR
ncbi:MAG TPA: hypothetical protein VNU68_32055 [Verrucomicrobiae bacterium]|nr:hypothetical protein [Verrucomicrobiae bacterium]